MDNETESINKTEQPDDQTVLAAIESICGDDFCGDMEVQACTGSLPLPLQTAIDKLGLIYRLAHSHVRSHSCYGVHDDWREEAREVYGEAAAERLAGEAASPSVAGDAEAEGEQEGFH